MKLSLCLPLFASCLAGCEDSAKLEETDHGTIELSGHARAAAAAAKVLPALRRDMGEKGMSPGDAIFLRAFKEERELELFVKKKGSGKYELFRTYRVAGTSGVPGPKLREGDGQVPEGFYFVPLKAMNPDSRYHLSFNIGYPNAYDRSLGRTGSHIMIHGNTVSIGCLAMTDAKIEEIFTLADAALRNGQPFFRVHIFPFRMTGERLERAAGSPHAGFWENLREGYERFEESGNPPEADVKDGRYVFR